MSQNLETTGPTSSSQNGVSASVARAEKEAFTKSKADSVHGDDGGIHYGRKFAETQERFQAKHAEREADAQASISGRLSAFLPDRERMVEASKHFAEDFSKDASGKLHAFQGAVGSLLRTGWEVALLPKDAFQLFARSIQEVRAR